MTPSRLADRIAARKAARRGGSAAESEAPEAEEPALRHGEYELVHRGKIEKVLSKDAVRPELGIAWMLELDGRMVLLGTDSYSLVVLPLRGEIREPTAISVEAAKAIGKAGSFFVASDGTITVQTGKSESYFDPPDHELPAMFKRVIEDVAEFEETRVVGLNPLYLRRIQEAFGPVAHAGLRLTIHRDGEAIVVTDPNDNPETAERYALLMGIRLPNHDEEDDDDE